MFKIKITFPIQKKKKRIDYYFRNEKQIRIELVLVEPLLCENDFSVMVKEKPH
jgi:hypothetical protein